MTATEACPRDWPEDFAHENGNYMNRCHKCREIFFGHKRRVTCKLCSATATESEKLEPCPFCGVSLIMRAHSAFHPSNAECWLASHELVEANYSEWNARTPRQEPTGGREAAAIAILEEIESANEAVCALRSDAAYQQLIAIPGMSDAMTRLDQARSRVRAALALPRQPVADEPTGGFADGVEAALRPFAKIADEYDDREDDTHQIFIDEISEKRVRITLGQCRAARAAITPTPAPKPAQVAEGMTEVPVDPEIDLSGVPEDCYGAFAWFVSRSAEGLGKELIAKGRTETQARNAIVHCFLDFAAGEACRVARREERQPDPTKWQAATDKAFKAAIDRTATPPDSRGAKPAGEG